VQSIAPRVKTAKDVIVAM
jgi:hypothetical protein